MEKLYGGDLISNLSINMGTYIDAHCHFSDPRWATNLDEIVARSLGAGVSTWIQGGVSPEEWDEQRRLRDRFGPGLVLTLGLHPWWVAAHEDSLIDASLRELERQANEASLIGEAGLDLATRGGGASSLARQLRVFEQILLLAKSARKPLVLHVVRAHQEALTALRALGPWPLGGIMHSFSGTHAEANAYAELGFLISVSGRVVRPGYARLKNTLRQIREELLVIESDGPDGGEPADLKVVAQGITSITGGDPESLLAASAARLRKLLEHV